MNPYPYVPPSVDALRAKDEADLNLLATLHYVWSGLFGCSMVGILGYFGVIAALISDTAPRGPHAAHEQAVATGIVVAVGGAMVLLMIPMLVLHLLAASGLKKRTRYMLAFVMACLTCLSFPLGTALGIWTILVLNRPSVKALFGR